MAVKMIDPNLAASLYQKTANVGDKQTSGGDGVSFTSFLKDTISDTIDTVKSSEKMSAQALTGQADLADVVQSVTAAELTIQTTLAVRDKIINAYQEIMRMPI